MKNLQKPPVAIFGLGRMGAQIARRLHKRGFKVVAWNRSPDPIKAIRRAGIFGTNDVAEAVARITDAAKKARMPRIFWIMLPHAITHEFILGREHLGRYLKKGDIVIDGGNSFYEDSVKLAAKLKSKGVHFFDCGTSGGVWGEKNGFALMVGGPENKWPMIEPIMKALSAGDNYGWLGKAGAGHFTKMVHNGIEYGMMEAIGEGYAVLEAGGFDLDLAKVTRIYQKGSVVRSWLIDLCRNIFETEDLSKVSGKVDASGEGEWTVKTAKKLGVDARVIEDALKVRMESADPKAQKKFSNKMVALMRKQFGGHAVHAKSKKY